MMRADAVNTILLPAMLSLTVAAPKASAQTTASARSSGEHVVRRLGGSTRFSPPVPSVDALRRMATTNRRDLELVLRTAGLSSISNDVLDALTNGRVMETSLATGEHLEWMALRRAGRPEILRNIRWEGPRPFEAYRFAITASGM